MVVLGPPPEQLRSTNKGGFMRVILSTLAVTYTLTALIMLTGCSVKIGVDWHGETSKDDRQYSEIKPVGKK